MKKLRYAIIIIKGFCGLRIIISEFWSEIALNGYRMGNYAYGLSMLLRGMKVVPRQPRVINIVLN